MRAALERVVVAWTLVGGALLLLVVLVTASNAAAYALDALAGPWGGSVAAIPGYQDFVTLTISAAALMMFPYCQLRRGHVAVDLFAERLPAGAQRWIDRASLVAMALLILFLCTWMVIGMVETRGDGVLAPILGWPVWPFYLPGLVSLVLWLAVVVLDLLGPAA